MKRKDVVNTINALKGEEGHQKVLEVYNAQNPLPRGYRLQYKDPWCAATVSAVLVMNGYHDISECSCPVMVKKAKDLGIWVENDDFIPQIGDIIMFDWQDSGNGDNQGNPDHVGIVVDVNKRLILVREGNKNGTLGNRDVVVNQAKIRGYITPPYEEEPEAELSGEIIGHVFPQIQFGSKGKAVAIWQIIADAKPDGEFGKETLAATKIFQETHNLISDGIVGDMTWNEGVRSI